MGNTAIGSQELWRRTFNVYCSKLPDFEPFKIDVIKNQYRIFKNENVIGKGIDKTDKGMDWC